MTHTPPENPQPTNNGPYVDEPGQSAASPSSPEAVPLSDETNRPGFFGQFIGTVKKNFLQKFQAPISMLFEILLPIVFVLGMVALWAAVGSETFEGKQFVHNGTLYDVNQMLAFPFCTNDTTPVIPPSFPPPKTFLFPCPAPLLNLSDVMCREEAGVLPEDNMCLAFNPMAPIQLLQNWSQPIALPTLDNLIILHFAWRHLFGVRLSIFGGGGLGGTLAMGGKIRFVPDNNATNELIAYINKTNPFFEKYMFGGVYPTIADAEAYVKSPDSELERNWAIVEVDALDFDNLKVKLRFNQSRTMNTNQRITNVYSGGRVTGVSEKYLDSGFLTLEKLIFDYWQTQIKKLPKTPTPLVGSMPFVTYTEWGFLVQGAGSGFFAMFIVLSFLYPVSQLIKSIVKEKESRIREAMFIMGLNSGSFYASWLVTYAIQFFFTSLISAIIMKGTFFPKNDFLAVFFVIWLFTISGIAFSGLLSTFFGKARIAAIVAPIVYFLIAMPLQLVSNLPIEARGVLLLLSPTALNEAFGRLANHEISGGLTTADIASQRDEINLLLIYVMLVFDTILYSLIALYLDAVIPSEWGTREHPCFCFLNFHHWLTKKDEDFTNLKDGRDEKGLFESIDESNVNPVRVVIRGFRKEFERGNDIFNAVDNLHLSMRENEITVLLGHNGSGKSTTINLITGMLEPTEGDCFVYGQSVRHDMANIRHDISFCPQHNILWDELTCYQHLDFYAALKGINGEEREQAIKDTLIAVDLLEKIDQKSAELSGGQKRKLSVAIAFIGRSRFVLLDEPTAGMDVAARRHTWDLIRRMSKGRCVLLTTHFMDEADLLGDSIAILAKGKLKTQGSPMFLKHNYSVGYKLTMSIDNSLDLAPLHNHIVGNIDTAVQEPTGSEELAYRLPLSSASKFADLFHVLEHQGESLGVRGFGVTVTTIEEVFLKIAQEEETGTATLDRLERKKQLQSAHHTASGAEEASAFTGKEPQPAPASPKWTIRASRDQTSFTRQFVTLCTKRFHNVKRDRRTQCLQIFLPVGCILLSMLLLFIEISPYQPPLVLNATTLYPPLGISTAELPMTNCSLPLNSTAFSFYTAEALKQNFSAVEFSQHLADTFKTHNSERYVAFSCNDPNFKKDIVWYNSTSFHSLAEGFSVFLKASADYFAGNNSGDVSITSYPMPRTGKEQALFDSIRSFIVGIVILIPFTFVPSTFVSWVVKEKEVKAKHLQLVSGMSYYAYWLSNIVFDIASFMFTELLVFLVFLIFDRKEYIGDADAFWSTFFVLFTYGISSVTMAYFLAFFFNEHTSAQNIVMMANFVCGFVLVFVIFMLQAFESTKDAAEVLLWIFRIVPSYSLGNSLVGLSALGFVRTFGGVADPWDMDVTGWNMVYMACSFPVYFACALLLDHPARMRSQQALFHKPDDIPPPIENEEEDVARERRRVENPDRCVSPALGHASPVIPASQDVVIVKNFRKEYGEKVAVKNLTFGVHKGEVFGFLGSNGAGKTTTISILCGEQLPTNGRGYVAGFDVVDESAEAQQNIGYCPQFDAQLELLTAGEHLRLFAGLRGVPPDEVEPMIDGLMAVCDLMDHKDTLSGNLSGGNRRKLSVAIALVGGPSVVFLDEPSAGMDPVARRGLWEVIDDVARHSSVVLTTHHLEEVEALAHRVAIMVDGELMCIGDKTHLKRKYGEGFEMNVNVHDVEFIPRFEGFVKAKFPEARLRERRGTRFSYTLPRTALLSFVFKTLETSKEDVGIEDYAVAQTSIESVFLRICEGEDDEDPVQH